MNSSSAVSPAFLSDSGSDLDGGDVFGRRSRTDTTWVLA